MSTNRSCEYRENDQWGLSHCNLLCEVSGLPKSQLTVVSDETCDACSQRFKPCNDKLNPIVASRLHEVTDVIIREKGIDGCDLIKGKELRNFAQKFLFIMPRPVLGGRGNKNTKRGACFFRGDKIGQEQCNSCRGNVRLNVYQCKHEYYQKTTIAKCAECLDFDDHLLGKKVNKWAVGILTAPRPVVTLERSLQSLKSAGWGDYLVFAEPDSTLPAWIQDPYIRQRKMKLGAWPNFFLGLTELMMSFPDADAYFMCEDDVIYTKGLKIYLENRLWPNPSPGVVSLYTPMHHERSIHQGFYMAPMDWPKWGSLAYVFSNPSARAFIRHARVVNHRKRGVGGGLYDNDSVVGQWCKDSGLGYYLHSPSLTQHIGEVSTLWKESKSEGRRSAATFPGEDVDINEWMSKSKASG